MAFDFPNSPTVGQIATGPGGQSYQFDGNKWVVLGGTTPGWIVISDTAPVNPAVGQFWLDSLGMQVYVYYQDPTSAQWIPISNQPSFGVVGNPNILINGACEIDQAHEGANVQSTGGSTPYVVDGIMVQFNAAAGTGQSGRSSTYIPPSGFPNSIYLQTATAAGAIAAGDFMCLRIPIEANEMADWGVGTSSAATLSLSFQAVLQNMVGSYTFNAALTNWALTRSYPLNFTLNAPNVWQSFSAQIPLDQIGSWVTSGNAGGAILWLTASAGTTRQAPVNTWSAGQYLGTAQNTNTMMQSSGGGAIFFTGIKLEKGAVATAFVRQSFQETLARCQRYYEKSYPIGTAVGATSMNNDAFWADWYQSSAAGGAGIQLGHSTYFKVSKRAIPTVSLYSPTTGVSGKMRDGNLNADVAGNIWVAGTNSFGWYCTTSTSTNNALLVGHMTADARL